MPVSRKNCDIVVQALKGAGINFVASVPETWLVYLVRQLEEDPAMRLVRLAREEEGVGLCAGAYFAGWKPAMLMQNHGFLASINGVVSLAHLYHIPFLMLISQRGDLGERDPWQVPGGQATVPVLRSLNIPHYWLDVPDAAARTVTEAQALAEASLRPVALLMARELLWEDDA